MKPHPEIYTEDNEEQEQFLRQQTKPFVFDNWKKGDVSKLVRKMRRIMREANGIGLSSNQIGLPWRMFVAEVPSDSGNKFYAIFNPSIHKKSKKTKPMYEGCLSIPGIYGEVDRHLEVMLKGQDRNGKSLKIKAWGLLAHVFQHEIDHLDGKLFIDKARFTEEQSPEHATEQRKKK